MRQSLKLKRIFTYGTLSLTTITAAANIFLNLGSDDSMGIFKSKSSPDGLTSERDNQHPTSIYPDSITKNGKDKNPCKVYRIVLTGGPCSGKTTGVKFIAEKLRERGIRAYTVPESATIIADGGGFINSFKLCKEGQVKLQSVISQLTLDLENRFYQLACNDGSMAVMLCDRGIMDGKAYCESDVWELLMKQKGWKIDEMRDSRYDAVLHMVTTAEGCATKYSNFNNRVRFETVTEALIVDKKLQEAWRKHPKFFILDNRYDFEHKLDDALTIVCQIIGKIH